MTNQNIIWRTGDSPGNPYIFNQYLPQRRQQGLAQPGIQQQLPSPPQMPQLPTYDMDYMRQAGRGAFGPIPPVDVHVPPVQGQMSPGDMRSIQPPAPVTGSDWLQRGEDILKGVTSIAKKVNNPFFNFYSQYNAIKDSVREEELGIAPPEDINLPWKLGGIGSRGVQFGKSLAGYFENELNALQTFDESVANPIRGAASSMPTLYGPMGKMPNPFYDREVEAIFKTLRGTVNPRTNEPYGPFESAQAAYEQAEMNPFKRFATDVVFDPLNIPGIKLGGMGLRAVRGVAGRAGQEAVEAGVGQVARQVPDMLGPAAPTRALQDVENAIRAATAREDWTEVIRLNEEARGIQQLIPEPPAPRQPRLLDDLPPREIGQPGWMNYASTEAAIREASLRGDWDEVFRLQQGQQRGLVSTPLERLYRRGYQEYQGVPEPPPVPTPLRTADDVAARIEQELPVTPTTRGETVVEVAGEVRRIPQEPAAAVPSPAAVVPESVPKVDRATLQTPERLNLLRESKNPIVRELIRIIDDTVGSGSREHGRAIDVYDLGENLGSRESKQLNEALVSLTGNRSRTTGRIEDDAIRQVPMRIRDETQRTGIRHERGYQISNLDRFIDELEKLDIAPGRVVDEVLSEESLINRANRTDLPEQYFDDAGELIDEATVTARYIEPLRNIVQVDKPSGGWASVLRKLERQLDVTEDMDIVDDIDNVRTQIDEFRDMEREGMSASEFGEAKDDAFYELQSAVDELTPSDNFMSTLDEAKEIQDELLISRVAEAIEPSPRAMPSPAVAVPEEIIEPIQPSLFGSAIPQATFRTARYSEFESAKNLNPRAENLAPKSPEEFARTKAYMSEDGNTGYLIDETGDFGNLFSNPGAPKGAGARAVTRAVNEGALTLDAYDGFLPSYYADAGFEEVARLKFVDEYAPPDWNYEKLGRPDVVIMAYTDGPRNSIINRYGTFAYSKTTNYVEDFDAAKELARSTARRTEDRLKRTDAQAVSAGTEAAERGRVVSGEPGAPREPGGVGAVLESELAPAPSPAGVRPSPAAVARTVDDVDMAEKARDIGPENMDRGTQQEIVRATGDASGHDNARNVVQDDAVRESVDAAGGNRMDDYNRGRDNIADTVSKGNPASADSYVRMAAKLWDSNFAMRRILDYRAKTGNTSISPHEAFVAGGDLDAVAAAHLSEGAVPRGFISYENLIKQKIEPLIGKNEGDIVGVTSSDISRLIQARHYKSIVDNPELAKRDIDNLPVPVDPKTGQLVEDIRNPDGSFRDVMEWEPYMRNNMTPEEFARVERGAEHVRDVYIKERDRLVKSGILTAEKAAEYAKTYPWYNPIVYIEFAEATGRGMAGSTSPFSNVSTGIFSMSDNVAVMGALDPLSTEVMLKQLVQNELRIKRNTVGKMIHHLVGDETQKDSLGWLREVTKQFENPNGTARAIPFNSKAKQGYLSFYEDGKRRVFGGIGPRMADGSPAPLQKDLFDFVYGKGGMASKGNYELENMLGWLAGMRRGSLTTFNPIFMFTNGIIDMFTVWLKRGIMPRAVVEQMGRRFNGIVNEADDPLVDIMRATGAFQSRTTNVSSYARNLQARINKAGFDGDVLWADDFSRSTKIRNQLDEAFDNGFVRPKLKKAGQKWSRTAQAIEQAARMEVAERTIIARLGADEWKRLKGLSREQFVEELLYNYRGTPGRGLADNPAVREAGMAALDSTVNFWRGGEWVRRINPLTYFLNAAMEGSKLPFRAMGVNLHPNIRPVSNPVPGGPFWEYGNFKEGLRRGATGRAYEELDITTRTTGNDVIDGLKRQHQNDTIPMLDTIERNLTGKGRGAANAAMTRMAGVLGAQATIMGWNLMHADEWGYWDIPGWVKYSGFLILLPPKRGDDGEYLTDLKTGNVKPNYLVIPHRTREWSLVTGAPQYFMEELAQTFDKTAEGKNSLKLFAKSLMTNMTPADNLPLLGDPTKASTYLKPFVGLRELGEQWQGRDYWRDEPIVSADLRLREPDAQYEPYTSESIRRLAGVLPENLTHASPLKLDHLVNSIFGGTGKTALSLPDWIFGTIDGMHRKAQLSEPRTPKEKVDYYRSLKTSVERRAYKGSVAREGMGAIDEFEDELRKPRREMMSIPFISDLSRRYNPPYAGGLREIGEMRQEELGFDVDKDQSSELRARLKDTRRTIYREQLEDDKKFQAWAYRKPGDTLVGITPSEWRKNRTDRFGMYDFFQKQMVDMFGEESVYSLTPEQQDDYYSAIYQIATKGGVQDTRMREELLLAGYYNIRYPEGDDPDLELVNKFYDAREKYINGIIATFGRDSDEFKDFDNARISGMTAVEVAYDKARQVMSSYFDIGSTADSFMPMASPQQKQLWDEYQRSTGQERAGFSQRRDIQIMKKHLDMVRRNYVARTIDQNGESNLDDLLAFWYGDYYYRGKAITTKARYYLNHLHGAIAPRTNYSTPTGSWSSAAPR